jgi:hypothetical protein
MAACLKTALRVHGHQHRIRASRRIVSSLAWNAAQEMNQNTLIFRAAKSFAKSAVDAIQNRYLTSQRSQKQ